MTDRPTDPDDEETGVADREADDETLLVDRQIEAETVVVDRPDRTVVVERGTAPDPSGPGDSASGDSAPEGTLAVTRERAKPAGSAPSMPGGRRRRGMTMPPVAPGFGRGAIDAVGPGAVATYEPREIPEPPAAAVTYPGAEATRAESPSMPSVVRRSRRIGLITLGVFAVCCVISIVGLLALAFAVFG